MENRQCMVTLCHAKRAGLTHETRQERSRVKNIHQLTNLHNLSCHNDNAFDGNSRHFLVPTNTG